MGDVVRVEVPVVPTGATPPVDPNAPVRPEHIPEKFWKDGKVDVDAMAKSYGELEKKGTKPEEKPAGTTEEKPVDQKPATENVDQAGVDALTKAGLKADDFITELQTNGELTPESYAKLATAGFSKSLVDTYLQGLQSTANAQADSVKELQAVAGGEEGFGQMANWVVEQVKAGSMTREEVIAYNKAVDSGDKLQAKLAIEGMFSRYRSAEGFEPTLVNANGGRPGPEVFRTAYEARTAMDDPRYGKDRSYTKEVEQKLLRSKVYG